MQVINIKKEHILELRRRNEDMTDHHGYQYIHNLLSKLKPEKNSTLNGIQIHDLKV